MTFTLENIANVVVGILNQTEDSYRRSYREYISYFSRGGLPEP